jgi:hypothetical protein
MHLQGQEAVNHINRQLRKFAKSHPGKTICVDFDSVVAHHEEHYPLHHIGKALGPGINIIKTAKKLGLKPVILTARPKQFHDKLEDFLKSVGAAAPVTNEKPPALMYIDDRAERYPKNFDGKMKSFESAIKENGGDGSMNMLDGHHYKSLATHESGVKGMKWGERKDQQKPEGTSVGTPKDKYNTLEEREEAAKKIWEEAEKQGYPREKVSVAFADQQFQLGGQSFYYAGACDIKTGLITIWPGVAGEHMPGVMAHEIEHAKFQEALNKYSEETSRLTKDHRKDDDGKDVMRADGTVRDAFKSDYPITVALQNSYEAPPSRPGKDFGSTRMYKDDGVSPYSRMWWDAWNKGEAKTSQAMHETMAEMARIKFETGKLSGTPIWRRYFTTMEKVYKGKL